MTSPAPLPLPAGWTISIHRVHNLIILTLRDEGGAEIEIGFHPLAAPGPQDETASALDQIADPGLRGAAQRLIDTFYARTEQAQNNCDAFGRSFPDLAAVLARLTGQVPGCTAVLDLDREALALVLTAKAPRASAPQLLALITRWCASAGSPDGGVDSVLDESGELTIRLPQQPAQEFLSWFRDEP
jgi:hypothetical protein